VSARRTFYEIGFVVAAVKNTKKKKKDYLRRKGKGKRRCNDAAVYRK